jgi:hypothetical protein
LQENIRSNQLEQLLKSLKSTLTEKSTKKTVSSAPTDQLNMEKNNLGFLQKMPKYTSGYEEFEEFHILISNIIKRSLPANDLIGIFQNCLSREAQMWFQQFLKGPESQKTENQKELISRELLSMRKKFANPDIFKGSHLKIKT